MISKLAIINYIYVWRKVDSFESYLVVQMFEQLSIECNKTVDGWYDGRQ